MDDTELRLQIGSLVLCPHCRGWHPVTLGHTEGTPYTLAMMYFVCRGGWYYAGQLGLVSRHLTRESVTDSLQGAERRKPLMPFVDDIGTSRSRLPLPFTRIMQL